jgi:putative glycosyltransferase (TIGR04348 family)
MGKPKVYIVSPSVAAANNGNWHTAARWREFLAGDADVDIVQAWRGEPADAMIALHARRSAASIAEFARTHPQRALVLVLTGTDLYRDLDVDAAARHSLRCAGHIVVLQDEAPNRLPPDARAKARVIVQSALRIERAVPVLQSFDLLAVGHLRAEKDPQTLMEAARRLPSGSAARIVHLGEALDPALGEAAQRTMRECERYRWLGGVSQSAARAHMARSRALVHTSRMEGGANAVIEAVRTQLPVLASRIDGNVGLLGRDYEGYVPVGDAAALAETMQRCVDDSSFTARLVAQCAQRETRFEPDCERDAVRRLLREIV